ncbi:hypothetical protein ABZ092_38450 [Streptomyces bobili]|uniref:hypothetical protein n=1 Tax=Streptomyces bobili TaxID=67280 RepID=UPI0033A2BD37
MTTAAAARAPVRAVVDACRSATARPAVERDAVDLPLVVSELVANAVRQGGGLVGIGASPARDGIRPAVHDHSDTVPEAAYAYGPGPPRRPPGQRLRPAADHPAGPRHQHQPPPLGREDDQRIRAGQDRQRRGPPTPAG